MRILLLGLTLLLGACAAPSAHVDSASHHPEARPFDEAADAMAAVDAALAAAAEQDKKMLLIMGANWCHDSRGLAGLFETPRFAELIRQHYALVYVDAGKPREDAANNMAVAQRFGVDRLIGTPNLFVIDGDGQLLNSVENVTGWTDAASRDPGEIYDFLAAMATR
ncbi:thioredoxin family protein [Sphingomicrobium flavum]|uniref:thioredoxin family protein n=1 Tax=Sphingomicrobium flavum TaxID=1229164 RepID=UPI0021ADEF39|nr:thioredoxin family protein [Sphingomicrobium flavum]